MKSHLFFTKRVAKPVDVKRSFTRTRGDRSHLWLISGPSTSKQLLHWYFSLPPPPPPPRMIFRRNGTVAVGFRNRRSRFGESVTVPGRSLPESSKRFPTWKFPRLHFPLHWLSRFRSATRTRRFARWRAEWQIKVEVDEMSWFFQFGVFQPIDLARACCRINMMIEVRMNKYEHSLFSTNKNEKGRVAKMIS